MDQIDQDQDIRPSEMNQSIDLSLSASEIDNFLVREINYLLTCKLEMKNKRKLYFCWMVQF